MITWGLTYWPRALIVAALAFIIPESIALATNAHNTLSVYCWHELHVSPHVTSHTIAWWISLIGWLLFTVVITLHIWGDWSG